MCVVWWWKVLGLACLPWHAMAEIMTPARMRLAAILLVIHVVHGLGYGYTEPRTSWVGWTAESYYTAVRWLLLTVLLLLATHLFSVLYLQWAVGSDTEEARDSVPIVLCALSQSVATRVSQMPMYKQAFNRVLDALGNEGRHEADMTKMMSMVKM